MNTQEYQAMIRRAQEEVVAHPRRYYFRLALWEMLGNAYILLVMTLLVVAAVQLVGIVNRFPATVANMEGAVAAIFTVFVIGKALFKLERFQEGVVMTPENAKALCEFVEETRLAVKCPPVQRIVLHGFYNCAIEEQPKWWGIFGPWQNQLIVGLGMLQALTVEEFRAILAHELGHISSQHGRFGCRAVGVYNRWRRIRKDMHKMSPIAKLLLGRFSAWYELKLAANFTGEARRHELDADKFAADAVGAQAVVRALFSAIIKGEYLEASWQRLDELCKEQPEPPEDLFVRLENDLANPVTTDTARALLEHGWRENDVECDHPSEYERAKALLPDVNVDDPTEIVERIVRDWRVEKSAARVLLGERLPEFYKQLTDQWRERRAPRWKSEHDEHQQKLARLAQLDAVAQAGGLSEQEAIARADLAFSLGDVDKAIETMKTLCAQDDEADEAHYRLGDYLLFKGDEEGVRHLQKAAQLNEALATGVYEKIYEHYMRCGLDSKAQEALALYGQASSKLAESRRKFATIGDDAQFEHADLDRQDADEVCATLYKDERVQQAYVVVRSLPEILGDYEIVIVLKLGRPWWHFAYKPWVQAGLKRVRAGFEGTLLSWSYDWDSAPDSLRRACKQVPGALFYDRKIWAREGNKKAAGYELPDDPCGKILPVVKYAGWCFVLWTAIVFAALWWVRGR